MKVRPMDQRFHSDLTFPGYLLNSVSISMYSQVHCWDGWGRTCPQTPGIPLRLRQAGKSCGLPALCVPLWLCLSVHPSLTPALPSHSVYLRSCSQSRGGLGSLDTFLIQRLGVPAYGKQKQEDCHSFQAILGYIVRSSVQNKLKEEENSEEKRKRMEQRRGNRQRRGGKGGGRKRSG